MTRIKFLPALIAATFFALAVATTSAAAATVTFHCTYSEALDPNNRMTPPQWSERSVTLTRLQKLGA